MSDTKESRRIKKGDSIFEEGERLKGVFCVRSGVSKLSKLSDNGRDQVVKLVSKGEVLGQRSVITDEQTNLSAIALEDMEVCFIPKVSITDPLSENVHFTKAILNQMAQDLKYADDTIVNMAQKSVRQRLAEVLIYLEENYGKTEDDFLKLQLTRADIADIIGTATELLIRTLTKFKKEGLVETSGKKIKLVERNRLKNIAEGL
ncbi:MAG: Crp/Fnr family transcriptional regulator [Nonlabens sp.]